MTDILRLQQIREWADDAAADDPEGDVILPGSWLVEILDERDVMQGALSNLASTDCTYLFHDEAGDECPGEVCEAKRGLGQLPPLSLGEFVKA